MEPIHRDANQNWHTTTIDETASRLNCDTELGLSTKEAKERQLKMGVNAISSKEKSPFWKEFLEELREPMVLMLLITGVLYAIWGELSDAITIFVIILLLNTVEVVNEQRSKKAISALKEMVEPVASVIRDGCYQELGVEQIVPGDLIVLQPGHRIPADARLIEAVGLLIDESILTGEPVSTSKDAIVVLKPETPIAERSNLVYSSTLVVNGKGTAMVFATGMDTEVGRITFMAREVKTPYTPLQNAMRELGQWLVWIALGFSVFVPLMGILVAHQPVKQMFLTGLSLAFATIPEELPIIITMVLALGAFRLSKMNAIAKHLKAVESLGSVTVIATDKTGTLTENCMEIKQYEPNKLKNHLLEIGILCNNARYDGGVFIGDPLDTAILRADKDEKLFKTKIDECYELINEFTFDNVRKRMSSVFRKDGQFWAAIKGAPESVLECCSYQMHTDATKTFLDDQSKQIVKQQAANLAAKGLRVLALAEHDIGCDKPTQKEVESNLTFVGLIGFEDPPRPEIRNAVSICKDAGIQTIMITGDHPLTAKAVAQQVGINDNFEIMTGQELDTLSDEEFLDKVNRTSIFARTTPEHKLRIVQALQAQGERVAVTGDGVNDAPALAAADIGIAMGKSGTDVAREACDIVLADDNFMTILNAVKEGRLIFENLKKGVRYYLTCKLALVFITLLPTLLLIPIPFAPIQIILMELFMDLMAAAAFVSEPAEADLLQQKPREPKAKFMDKKMDLSILTSSIGLFAAVSLAYLITWYGSQNQVMAQTVAFFSWLIGHVLLAINMRSERQPILQLGLGSNRLMLIWGGAVAIFLIIVSLFPAAEDLLKVTSLTINQWGMIIVFTLLGTFWMEIIKIATYKH